MHQVGAYNKVIASGFRPALCGRLSLPCLKQTLCCCQGVRNKAKASCSIQAHPMVCVSQLLLLLLLCFSFSLSSLSLSLCVWDVF
jgi:hypothetical protein